MLCFSFEAWSYQHGKQIHSNGISALSKFSQMFTLRSTRVNFTLLTNIKPFWPCCDHRCAAMYSEIARWDFFHQQQCSKIAWWVIFHKLYIGSVRVCSVYRSALSSSNCDMFLTSLVLSSKDTELLKVKQIDQRWFHFQLPSPPPPLPSSMRGGDFSWEASLLLLLHVPPNI